MNRIVLIFVAIFALMAVSPALDPALARHHVPVPAQPATLETAPANGPGDVKLAARIARCDPAPAQKRSTLCVLKGALLVRPLLAARQPERHIHRLVVTDPIPPRSMLDELLWPPKRM